MRTALVIALMLAVSSGLANIGTSTAQSSIRRECKSSRQAIIFYRNRTWNWQEKSGQAKTSTSYSERWAHGCPYLRWVAKLWVVRNNDARAGYIRYRRTLLSSPKVLGQRLAALRGWTGAQWECLEYLWGPLEGGWNVHADNPHSDAYGIPQALPGSKMGDGWEHSAFTQITWGLGYISGRYGTPCGALSYRLNNGYY